MYLILSTLVATLVHVSLKWKDCEKNINRYIQSGKKVNKFLTKMIPGTVVTSENQSHTTMKKYMRKKTKTNIFTIVYTKLLHYVLHVQFNKSWKVFTQ